MTRAIRAAGATAVEYDPEQFCLHIGGGNSNTLFLFNAYQEYLRAGRGNRKSVLRRYSVLGGPKESERTYNEVKSDLLPKVRERYYLASIPLIQRSCGSPTVADDIPTLRLCDDITVEIIRDFPDRVGTVSAKTFEKWGVRFEEAMGAARDNLWRKSNEAFTKIGPSTYLSPWKDNHDASRLFLHDLIWQLPVKGSHVAMVPNRNTLLVTGSDDEEGLLKIATMAEDILRETRPMTGVAVRLNGSRWESFVPPPASAAHWPMRRVAAASLARHYAEQGGLLDAVHKKENKDVFVASQSLIKDNGGRTWTWTSWVDGVANALMPIADMVAFGRTVPGSKPLMLGFAQWNQVASVLANHMELTDLYPPRYRVTTFPTPQELGQLALRTVASPYA